MTYETLNALSETFLESPTDTGTWKACATILANSDAEDRWETDGV